MPWLRPPYNGTIVDTGGGVTIVYNGVGGVAIYRKHRLTSQDYIQDIASGGL